MNLISHLDRQRDWSTRTFGDGAKVASILDHIRKELVEIEANPNDLIEWVDVVILALDGAWRAGHSSRDIAMAILVKQAENERRAWPAIGTYDAEKAIEHIR